MYCELCEFKHNKIFDFEKRNVTYLSLHNLSVFEYNYKHDIIPHYHQQDQL